MMGCHTVIPYSDPLSFDFERSGNLTPVDQSHRLNERLLAVSPRDVSFLERHVVLSTESERCCWR